MSQYTINGDKTTAYGVLTDLINSEPARAGSEGLSESSDLDALAEKWDLSFPRAGTPSELMAVRNLRMRLERAFNAETTPIAIEIINEMFFSAGSVPQIAVHEGNREPHMHYSLDDSAFADQVSAMTAMALAQLLVRGAYGRLRECAGVDCRLVFIDTSKNGSRIYHDSQACGNKLHAARYRARRGVADDD